MADPGIRDAWRDIAKTGGTTPAALDSFLNDPRVKTKISPTDRAKVEALKQAKEAQEKLPFQTPDQTARDIDRIKNTIGSSGSAEAVSSLETLEKLNTLAQLAEASTATSNPIGVMAAGCENAGFPLAFCSEICGVPIMEDPIADSSATVASGLLINPQANGQAVNYTLDGRQFTMDVGEQQSLAAGYIIEFDPGNGANKRYKLGEGTYEWRIEGDGWMLRKVDVVVSLDNTEMDSDFHLLADGEPMTVPAGEAVELESPRPIEIVFDRGDKRGSARKVLSRGDYAVGVDAQQQRLDLFKAEAAQAEDEPGEADLELHASRRASSQRKPRTAKQKVDQLLARLKK
jgi:hypothetical protein